MQLEFIQPLNLTATNDIGLAWIGIATSPENGKSIFINSLGGDPNIDYKVYFGNGKVSDPWLVLADSTSGKTEISSNDYTTFQFLPNVQYKFMVQGFNTYGGGPNSTVLFKETLEGGNTLPPSGFAAILALITGLASMCA
jgi:hypothetical protein